MFIHITHISVYTLPFKLVMETDHMIGRDKEILFSDELFERLVWRWKYNEDWWTGEVRISLIIAYMYY